MGGRARHAEGAVSAKTFRKKKNPRCMKLHAVRFAGVKGCKAGGGEMRLER